MDNTRNPQSLKRLSRRDLLELLIEQNKRINQLTARLNEAEKLLMDRSIAIEEAGSIAQAALQLNGVFAAAQNACDQYLENIRRRSELLDARCQALDRISSEIDSGLMGTARSSRQPQEPSGAENPVPAQKEAAHV